MIFICFNDMVVIVFTANTDNPNCFIKKSQYVSQHLTIHITSAFRKFTALNADDLPF